MKNKTRINEIKIASGKYKEFYFAVAHTDYGLISCSLGRLSEREALEDIYEFIEEENLEGKNLSINLKLNSKKVYSSSELIEKIGKYYYGEHIQNSELECSIENNFNFKVLKEVSEIPYGEFRTYKEIGESIGTKGYRAVGNALNRNPLPLIIPCHRVVKSDMTIGGFRGGLEMKKELLKREGIRFNGNKIIRN